MGRTLALKAGEGVRWGLLLRKLLARSSAQRVMGEGRSVEVLRREGERGRYKVVWVWGNSAGFQQYGGSV